MDLEKEYIEYVAESSLALLAVSAVYFLDFRDPVTLLTLLPFPVLFGYTSYISREGFRKASLLGGVSLIFIPLGLKMGLFAVSITIANLLVSVFSGGTGMNSYSSSTYLPMILTGLIMGFLVFGAAQSDQGLRTGIVNGTSSTIADTVSGVVNGAGIIDSQKEAVGNAMEAVSRNSVLLTAQYVRNRTDFDRETRLELQRVFSSAREEIPERIGNRTESRAPELDISSRVKDAASRLIGSNMAILGFATFMIFYTLNPIVSIFTGVFGKIFEKLGEK